VGSDRKRLRPFSLLIPGRKIVIMAQTEESTSGVDVPSRVTYQGITYTICRSCYLLIGSGKNEETLLAFERLHRCQTVNSGMEYGNGR
jgi:hypothetical protein